MEMTIPAKSTRDLLQDLKNSAQIADYLQGNKDALLQGSFTDELNRLYKRRGETNRRLPGKPASATSTFIRYFPDAACRSATA